MNEKILIESDDFTQTSYYKQKIVYVIGAVIFFIVSFANWDRNMGVATPTLFLGILCCIAFVVVLSMPQWHLCVTDKRVYARLFLGRKIELPIDSISAIRTHLFKGVSVTSSSGRITLFHVGNYLEIYETISELLIQRQEKKD